MLIEKKHKLKSIYNLIKSEIESSPFVLNSVLHSVKPWKRSHFIILSEIIKDQLSSSKLLSENKKMELGNSISHITLQRFFENDYQDKTHNDLRFLKTLDKISIFLGYPDLNAFVAQIKNNTNYSDELFSEKDSTELVYNYCKTNFEFFKKFPVLDLTVFDDLIFPDAPFLERIKTYSEELTSRGLKLITKNNKSNFEIFDLNVISDTLDSKVIRTQEFWSLYFEEENSDKRYNVHELTTQIYFIKKIGNTWKIWDNYNPNSGLLNTK